MSNPYQAPESVPDGPANIDFDSLPLTVPRRSRLERVYPILLGLWAAGILCYGLYISQFADEGSDVMMIGYGTIVTLASIGIWRKSRVAEVIAIILLAIAWLIAVLNLASAAGVLTHGGVRVQAVAFYVAFVSIFVLPTSVFLVLAWFVWRWRSN